MMKNWIVGFVLALFSVGSAYADWHEVRTDNFIVQGDASLATLKSFTEELEQFRVFLAVVAGQEPIPEPVPAVVFLMTNGTSFEKILDRKNVGGVYRNELEGGIFAANVQKRNDKLGLNALDIVKHEYVHHYTYRTGPFFYPLWYREGIAEYFSTFTYNRGIGEVGKLIQHRISWLNSEKWFPVDYLFQSVQSWYPPPGRQLEADDVAVYYAQSWFTVHYLQHTPQRAVQLNNYLVEVNRTGNSVEAFNNHFDVSFEQLQDEIEAVWQSRRLPLLRVNLENFYHEPALTVTKLDKTEADIRLALMSSELGLRATETRTEKFEALVSLLEQSPNDIRLLYRLALMKIEDNKFDEATPYIDRAVDNAPTQAQTLILQGLSEREKIKTSETLQQSDTYMLAARDFFDRARKAAPKNPRAHYEYSRSFLSAVTPVTEEALDAALLAMELSPDDYDVPFNAALLLDRRGYKEDAIFLLEGLAGWASDQQKRREAQRELDRIRRSL